MIDYTYDPPSLAYSFVLARGALENALKTRKAVGFDAGRLARAYAIALLPASQRRQALDKYQTTGKRCGCPDAANGFVCKHRLATRLMHRAEQHMARVGWHAKYEPASVGWRVVARDGQGKNGGMG